MYFFRRNICLFLSSIFFFLVLLHCLKLASYFSSTLFEIDLQLEGLPTNEKFEAIDFDRSKNVKNPPINQKRFKFDTKKIPVDPEMIVEYFEFLNSHHEVLNENRFGLLNNMSVKFVILIQIHNRTNYLVHLIDSLRAVRDIELTLLIFSLDLINDAINKLICSITFTRVIQVFYPYNIQIFLNVFPGHSIHDCPAFASKQQAEQLQCKNRMYPDKYGHYRLASITQIKHHWWWKLNYVFDEILKKYKIDRYVVLLEEDHYVLPDFLHVLNIMVNKKNRICPNCQVLTLGAYLNNHKKFKDDISKLSVSPWFSSKHNMGMAINLETWRQLKNCSEIFCKFDDYNWDWSLLEVSNNCMPTRLQVIFAKSLRVIHIGDCGVHSHQCASEQPAAKAINLINKYKSSFFPEDMHLFKVSQRSFKAPKPNGGWADIRDVELCFLNAKFPHRLFDNVKLQLVNSNKFSWLNYSSIVQLL